MGEFCSSSLQLEGSIRLGDASGTYTIARTARGTLTKGRSTYIVGQASGFATSDGGDVFIDAGAGGPSGVVRVGTVSAGSVELGSLTSTVKALGHMQANTASVSGLLQATGISTAGSMTASTGLSAGTVSAGAVTASGAATAASFSTAGAVTAATGFQTAGTVTATTGIVSGAIQAASVTSSGCCLLQAPFRWTQSMSWPNSGQYFITRRQAAAAGATTFVQVAPLAMPVVMSNRCRYR